MKPPGISTRNDVEKLFGKGNPERHIVDYQMPDGMVTILYSYGDCDCSNCAKMVGGVPECTAEEAHYSPLDSKLSLRDVILEVSKFKKRHEGDVTIHVKYYNDEAGISIIYDEKHKTVEDIILLPTSEQKKRFSCQKKK